MANNGENGSDGGGTLPSWVSDLRPLTRYVDTLVEFAKSPSTYIVTFFIGFILDLWSAVLGYFESYLTTMAAIPEAAILRPILTAFGRPASAVVGAWESVGEVAFSVAPAAGPLAPVVVVMIWFVPMIMIAAGVHFVVGFLDTYLPLTALPGVGRWLR